MIAGNWYHVSRNKINMEAVAKLNNYPTSPRKMRLLADLIRGLEVEKALSILQFNPKHPAMPMHKLLKSAINNWEQKNIDEKVEDAELIVKTIMVDCGRVIKRMRPAPQGRGYRIRKRSNHVTIIVDSAKSNHIPEAIEATTEAKEVDKNVETKKPAAKKTTAKKPAAKKVAPKSSAAKKAEGTKNTEKQVDKAEKKSTDKTK